MSREELAQLLAAAFRDGFTAGQHSVRAKRTRPRRQQSDLSDLIRDLDELQRLLRQRSRGLVCSTYNSCVMGSA